MYRDDRRIWDREILRSVQNDMVLRLTMCPRISREAHFCRLIARGWPPVRRESKTILKGSIVSFVRFSGLYSAGINEKSILRSWRSHEIIQASMPNTRTGISILDIPLFSKSQTNCSKYDTPVDISSANCFIGTISTPASTCPILLNIVIFAHTL